MHFHQSPRIQIQLWRSVGASLTVRGHCLRKKDHKAITRLDAAQPPKLQGVRVPESETPTTLGASAGGGAALGGVIVTIVRVARAMEAAGKQMLIFRIIRLHCDQESERSLRFLTRNRGGDNRQ
jgi:hypothetical protein